METTKVNALVSLLDDDDTEVALLVEKEIKELGEAVIPLLENHWGEHPNNPALQRRLEDIIQEMQFDLVANRLRNWKNEHPDDLLMGLWAVATLHHPTLTLASLRAFVQELQFEAWVALRDDLHPYDQIKILNHVFFEKYHFTPNTKQYHAVNNSMINEVISSRRSNPIGLSSLYLLMAQKAGIPIYGVNLPNNFVLTYKGYGIQFYINVFSRGVVFSKADIDAYLKPMNLTPQPIFYEPCSNQEIVRRTLRNLHFSFEKQGQTEKSTQVEQLLELIK